MKKNFLILLLILILGQVTLVNFVLSQEKLAYDPGTIPGYVHVTFTTQTINVCPPGILGKGRCDFPSTTEVINKIIDLVISISPLVFVILIIIGGFMYLFSPFKFEQIKTGHKYILWAIYGFILVLITSLIFEFIADIFGGSKP